MCEGDVVERSACKFWFNGLEDQKRLYLGKELTEKVELLNRKVVCEKSDAYDYSSLPHHCKLEPIWFEDQRCGLEHDFGRNDRLWETRRTRICRADFPTVEDFNRKVGLIRKTTLQIEHCGNKILTPTGENFV